MAFIGLAQLASMRRSLVEVGSSDMEPSRGENGLGMVMFLLRRVDTFMPLKRKVWLP